MSCRSDDVVLAVNEAVTNVVRHAYPDEDGELEVLVEAVAEGVSVHIRDNGRGPGPWRDTAGSGLGTMVMEGLADSVIVSGRTGTGTEVALTFHR